MVAKKDVVEKNVLKKEPLHVEAGKPIFTYDFNTMQCTRHGTSEDAKQIVSLEAGPNGLLVANFGQAVHSTELSNLMLLAAPKKKNDKLVLKRPAAASVADPAQPAVLKKPAAAPMAEPAIADPAHEAPHAVISAALTQLDQ